MAAHRKSGLYRPSLVGVLATGLLVLVLAKWPTWRRDPNRLFRAMYNLVAPIYDLWAGEKSALAPLRQQLAEMMELEPGDQVLEVGAGTGA
ncbi:MAG TPA: hypothetical protein VHS06_03990, partial [Chloroflexota bacterium]|nr:hypothetical protein [Chloroflexota bacterium]